MSYNDKRELKGQKTSALMFQSEKLSMLNVTSRFGEMDQILKQDFSKKQNLNSLRE